MNTYRILPGRGADGPTLFRYHSWDDTAPEAIAQKCNTHPVLWALAEELAAESAMGGALRLSVAIALGQAEVSP